ncbi:hypothetical protein HNQ75_003901 [Rhizobium flavum]|uniref:Uncharacterized protein n=1 Tax=Pseudorhizobium flavum TaxID=1335061 RepID=A0A7W9Z0Q6_9HYPH|nr:hypothetical protein [Pseudorhizobium flavum]CAD6628824.1 transposase [Pseudorhizobium flavum]
MTALRRHRKVNEVVIRFCDQAGLSYSEIARRTGYERRSVTKWLQFEAASSADPHITLIFRSLLDPILEGNCRGQHLCHDVKQRGYTGSFANLKRSAGAWRRAEREQSSGVPPVASKVEPVRDPETGHAISPVVAAALYIKPRGLMTDRQARKVDALKQGSEAFAEMQSLAMRFNGILRG